eukprot:CAMPEP_0185753866 /NCGR_PEP_ID=MMETSP1174-20130828/12557_1 /TAXON_ID=35687 /ORGANISM="Dictyocha speculum, Strain CCMP1381" /LENGTH=607 /DNA_ID=CAMNT_0028431881 /DNA_START=46 /DNA_END=1869 /DNA_ORIENTATION=+
MPKGKGGNGGKPGFVSNREIRSLGYASVYNRVQAVGKTSWEPDLDTVGLPDDSFMVVNIESGRIYVKLADVLDTNSLVTMLHDLLGIPRRDQVLTYTTQGPGGTRPLKQKENPYKDKVDHENKLTQEKLLTAEEMALGADARDEVFHARRAEKDAEAIATGSLQKTPLTDGLPSDWNRIIMVHNNDQNVWRTTSFSGSVSPCSTKFTVHVIKDANNLRHHAGFQLQLRSSEDGNEWTQWGSSTLVTTDTRKLIHIVEGASFDYLIVRGLETGHYYDIRVQLQYANTSSLWTTWSADYGPIKAVLSQGKSKNKRKKKSSASASKPGASSGNTNTGENKSFKKKRKASKSNQKQPRSAKVLFMMHHKKKLNRSDPDMAREDVHAKLKEMWNDRDEAESAKWEAGAKRRKAEEESADTTTPTTATSEQGPMDEGQRRLEEINEQQMQEGNSCMQEGNSMSSSAAIGRAQVYNFLARIPVGNSFKDWTRLYYQSFLDIGMSDFDLIVGVLEFSETLDEIVGTKKLHKNILLRAIKAAEKATKNGTSAVQRCPITLEPLDDPVRASDGHVYSRAAITRWFQDHERSPMTNSILDSKALDTVTDSDVIIIDIV